MFRKATACFFYVTPCKLEHWIKASGLAETGNFIEICVDGVILYKNIFYVINFYY